LYLSNRRFSFFIPCRTWTPSPSATDAQIAASLFVNDSGRKSPLMNSKLVYPTHFRVHPGHLFVNRGFLNFCPNHVHSFFQLCFLLREFLKHSPSCHSSSLPPISFRPRFVYSLVAPLYVHGPLLPNLIFPALAFLSLSCHGCPTPRLCLTLFLFCAVWLTPRHLPPL